MAQLVPGVASGVPLLLMGLLLLLTGLLSGMEVVSLLWVCSESVGFMCSTAQACRANAVSSDAVMLFNLCGC